MQVAILDHRHQFCRARFEEPDLHTRILFFVRGHKGREEGSKRVRGSADSQDAGSATAERAACGEHRVRLAQQSAAVTKKLLAFSRQQESAAQIVEQRKPQLFLQSLNPARQRRLSDAQFGCGP